MTEGGNIGFELHTINLGKNVHEKMIATCVMMEIDLPAEDAFDDLPDLSDRERIALNVFTENENEDHKLKLTEFRSILRMRLMSLKMYGVIWIGHRRLLTNMGRAGSVWLRTASWMVRNATGISFTQPSNCTEAAMGKIPNRRPCINTRTENFHFSVGFNPHTGHPVEFFITGRGKVGQQLDTELYELSVKASKLMQGEE